MKTLVLGGRAAKSLCQAAIEADADLAVVGVGEQQGPNGRGIGSTARRVLNDIGCSVLLVPAAETGKPKAGDDVLKRVIVPFDGSAHAESALRFAFRIAQESSAELVLLHAVPEGPLASASPAEAEEQDKALLAQIRSRGERIARKRLDRIRRLIPTDTIRSRFRILRDGGPRQALSRAVSEEAGDLLVLSARGIGNDPELPVGSTADYLITHAEIPVLLVRGTDGPNAHRAGGEAPRWPGRVRGTA